MSGNLGAVVLASGESRRFEGGPKLLAPFQGKPLLQYVLEALPSALFARRLAVTRIPAIQALAQGLGFETILHGLPDLSDTIRLGAEAMEAMDGCLFSVGDQPLLTARTVERLVRVFERHPGRIVRASGNGAPGNPVLFPRACFPDLRNLPPGRGGGYVIGLWPEKPLLVETEDPRELWDVDTRQEYEALTHGGKEQPT